MASPLKTVPRPVTTEPESELVGIGLPLQEEVTVEEQDTNLSLPMLGYDSLEQKRERVERMFDNVAALVSQLSPELCKENHGGYMVLSAKIEQLCLCIQARLVSLEHDVSTQEIPDVPLMVRLLRLFTDRARRIIHARAERIRKRDADAAVIRSWRELISTERVRPAKIHEEAVQHVKRLLMYDDQRYLQLPTAVQQTSAALRVEEQKNYYGERCKALREAVAALQAQAPLLDKEFYDKALQKVQESDNGPRPK